MATTEQYTTIPLRNFRVGVFPHAGKRPGVWRYMAYTRDYNRQWQGCCEHEVRAINGTEAKKQAIAEHRASCISRSPERAVTRTTTRDGGE